MVGDSMFVSVIENVVSKMLSFETSSNRIYVDLNSILSIIFHYSDFNSDELFRTLKTQFEKFHLEEIVNKNRYIIYLFTTKPSKYHTTIFPDWCKNRYSGVDLNK